VNIVDFIEEQARLRPDAPAILRGDMTLSFARLAGAVRRAAAILAGQGVRAGAVVGTALNTTPLHLVTLLALLRMGAIALPGRPITAAERWREFGARFGLAALVAERAHPGVPQLLTIRPDASWARDYGGGESPAPHHPGGEQLYLIAQTSGTTGPPKAVARTHAGFLALRGRLSELLGVGRESRFLVRMDIQNQVIVLHSLRHLCAGGAVVFADAPLESAFRAIERHGATHTIISPFILCQWLAALARPHAPFASLAHLIVAGGELPGALVREAEERVSPNLVNMFGSVEMGVGALGDRATRARYPGSAGRLVPWLEAQAVDDEDRPLPPGESGRLRFRGESVVTSYHGPEAGSRSADGVFRDGWCYTGDVGRVTAERILHLEGRADDEINLGGPKLQAREVEAILAGHPDVLEAAAFALGAETGQARLMAAVVPRGRFDAAALRRHYAERGGALPELLTPVRVQELPRNAMGKVLKQELKARFARGG